MGPLTRFYATLTPASRPRRDILSLDTNRCLIIQALMVWNPICSKKGMTSEKKSFLLAQLQEAIDEAVSESGRIGEIVEEMKRCGYDLCLMLESTVTISPASEDQGTDAAPEVYSRVEVAEEEHDAEFAPSKYDFEFTERDLEFLQELNIAVSA
jgi:hypothetical protein